MPAKRKDFEEAVKMYESGLSIGDVANSFDVTRQAMWKILKRRDVVFRPHLKFSTENHFFIDGKGYEPHQMRARNLVMKAIAKGVLIPGPCEQCGFTGKARDGRNLVHAHHDDYSKPLEVRWLCKRCHHDEHYGATPVRVLQRNRPSKSGVDQRVDPGQTGNRRRSR